MANCLGILVLIGWVPVITAICLRRLIGRGDMGPVGVVGLVLVLYGLPATFIGCPSLFPGIVLVGAASGIGQKCAERRDRLSGKRRRSA